MTRAEILVVLERCASRCLDDEDDRAAVADALAAELQGHNEHQVTARADAREDG